MSAELGSSEDPRALVPGDPAAVAADARILSGRAADLVRTGAALRRIGTGSWTGRAADAWRQHHDEDAVRWFQGADSLDSAAGAVAGHADALRRAQSEAARAVALWREGDSVTADVRRQVAAGAVAPPVDPGDAARRDAVAILAAARADLARSGDRVAAVLRGEAVLAPRDSQKQIDADFYGGMWDSVSGAFEGVLTLAGDPGGAIEGAVAAAAHPVDTAKDAIAHDDWTGGREPRALGRNAGDLFLGAATLGAGKIASILGRETRIAGEHPHPFLEGPPDREPEALDAAASGGAAATPATRSDVVRDIVLGSDGRPHGRESSKGVYMVDEPTLNDLRARLEQSLGKPDHAVTTGKGQVEVWSLGDNRRTNVTYRSFSSSGGATIDVNRVDGVNVNRFHIEGGGTG